MKVETIKEFLARGGEINHVPTAEASTPITHVMTPTSAGPAVLLTYGEADLFYGEVRARKSKKVKQSPKIDFNALPEGLRKKYTKELLSGGQD